MAAMNTPYATLSFASLFKPRPPMGGVGDPQFEATLIFDPAAQKSPAYLAMLDAVATLAAEKFPKVQLKHLKLPFKDSGELEGKWQGYRKGDMYIKARTKTKPGVVNAVRQDILLPEEVWSGQLVRANVAPFSYDVNGVKGISFALNHIQIVNPDKPRLDGRAPASSAFDDGLVDEAVENMF